MNKLFPTYREERDSSPTEERYSQFLHDTNWVHFVARRNPPWIGINQCIAYLHHSHYRPADGRSDLFNLTAVLWNEEEWYVISIPIHDRPLFDEIAEGCGLQIMRGRPVRTVDGTASCFPFDSPNMHLLAPRSEFQERIRDPLVLLQFVLQEQLTIRYITGEISYVYLN